MAEQKKKKKKNIADKKQATKVILMTDEDTNEEKDIDEEEDDESGMYLEKEDMLLIYKALKNYKPVNEEEEMTYEMLIEQLEEILVVDYKVKLPVVRW
jgi:hypothetical protein